MGIRLNLPFEDVGSVAPLLIKVSCSPSDRGGDHVVHVVFRAGSNTFTGASPILPQRKETGMLDSPFTGKPAMRYGDGSRGFPPRAEERGRLEMFP